MKQPKISKALINKLISSTLISSLLLTSAYADNPNGGADINNNSSNSHVISSDELKQQIKQQIEQQILLARQLQQQIDILEQQLHTLELEPVLRRQRRRERMGLTFVNLCKPM